MNVRRKETTVKEAKKYHNGSTHCSPPSQYLYIHRRRRTKRFARNRRNENFYAFACCSLSLSAAPCYRKMNELNRKKVAPSGWHERERANERRAKYEEGKQESKQAAAAHKNIRNRLIISLHSHKNTI